MIGRASIRAALSVTLLGGCSLVAQIDVCDRPPVPEGELNTRTEGDQILQGTRALTATPDGRAVLAFTSRSAASPDRAEVRIVRMASDATPIATCDEPRERTIAADDPLAAPAFRGGASVVATDDATLPLVISWAEDRPDGDRALVLALKSESACGYHEPPITQEPFVLSDRPGGLVSPPLGLWTGGPNFVFVWFEADRSGASSTTYGRVLRIDHGGTSGAFTTDARTGERTTERAVPLTSPGTLTLGIDAIAADDRVVIARYVGAGDERQIEISIHREDLSIEVPAFAVSERFRESPAGRIALAYDGEQVLVAWSQSDGDAESSHVWARFLTLGGDFLSSPVAPEGGAFRVATGDALTERAPAAVEMSGGGFVVGWTSVAEEGNSLDIRGALFGPGGGRQFANRACDRTDFRINQAERGDQGNVSFARLGDQILAAWTDAGANGADTSGTAVRATVIDPRALLPIR